VCKAIKLPFGMVSGVSRRIGLLDGDPDPPQGRYILGEGRFSSIDLNGVSKCIGNRKHIQLDGTSVRTVYQQNRYLMQFLKNVLCYEIKVAIYKKNCKNAAVNLQRNCMFLQACCE